MLLRLLALARAPVELAEAEVAVGDEGGFPSGRSARPRVRPVGGAASLSTSSVSWVLEDSPPSVRIGERRIDLTNATAPDASSFLSCTNCPRA